MLNKTCYQFFLITSVILIYLCPGLLNANNGDFSQKLKAAPDSKKAEILNQWAYSVRNRDYNLSRQKAEEALKWAEKFKNEAEEGWAMALIGLTEVQQGKLFSADITLNSALEICQKLDQKEREFQIINWLGILHFYIGDYKKALGYYQIIVQQNESAVKPVLHANAQSNIGIILYRQGHYSRAMEYYLKALDLYEELGLSSRLPPTLINIGIIFNILKNPQKALEYYNKALVLAREFQNKTYIAGALENIGIVQSRHGNFKDARENLLKSMSMRKKNKNIQKINHLLYNLALVERRDSHFEQSQRYLDQAIKLHNKIKSNYFKGTLLREQSELYLVQGEYSKALATAKESLKAFAKSENKKQEIFTYLLLSNIYNSMKDYSQALHYYKKYQTEHNKYWGSKVVSTVLDQDFKKRQKFMEKQISQIRQRKKHILLAGILISLLLIFGLLATWVGRQSLRRRSQALLKMREEEIRQAQSRLQWMMGELKEYLALKNRKRYEKSNLTPRDSRRIYQALKEQMAGEEKFQNPDLTLNSLGETIGCSAKVLSQVINEQSGKNFSDFVNRYRVNMAKKLLTETPDLPILEVAYDVGFNSKSSFNTSFKKLTGQTPREYRQQHLS